MKGTEMDRTGTETSESKDGITVSTLAFISLTEIDKDIFRGGILITDLRGKPLEFRCTSAIQPNNVQKTLYGSTLQPHMSVELVGLPLLKSISEKPNVIMIQQAEFLDMRISVAQPVLLLSRQGVTLTVAESGQLKTVRELINSPSGKFEPIVVTSHWEYGADLRITQQLRTLCTSIDLMEPFDRIQHAIKFVHDKGIISEKS
jgi:hypothetical protein